MRPPGLLQVGFVPGPLPPWAKPTTFLEGYESCLERVEIDLDDCSHV
jgi:hypothetical protein